MNMWQFLQIAKPKPPKTNSIIKEVCYMMDANSEATMCWALDILKKYDYEVKKMGCIKDKIEEEFDEQLQRIEDNCQHEYISIYRHFNSDMKCKHCGKVITHEHYMKLYGFEILQKQVDKLEKELYNKKQELGNQKSPNHNDIPPFTQEWIPTPNESLLTKGWICPVCGCGNAPTNKTCPCRTMYKTNQPWQNPVTYNNLNCVTSNNNFNYGVKK